MNVRNRDQFMDEKQRYNTGAFFTPKKWVDEAHKMLDEQLGPNWREEYVVWDASAGTANLTRDYKFKELYLSTLEQTDVDIILKSGFNPGAVVFQFDFLNDPIEDSIIGGPSKLPEGLKKALEENRPIVFLNNPPYGNNTSLRDIYVINNELRDKKHFILKKTLKYKTMVYNIMKENKLGIFSTELSKQYIFQLVHIIEHYGLTNSYNCIFFPEVILNRPSFKKYRNKVFDKMTFIDGFIFPSTDFSGIKTKWPVAFTIFSSTTSTINNHYKLKYIDVDKTIKHKFLYNQDDLEENIVEWIKLKNQYNTEEIPYCSNPIKIKTNLITNKKPINSLGWAMFTPELNYIFTNNILSTSLATGTNKFFIMPENLYKVCSCFIAGFIISVNLFNQTNSICIPDEQNECYQQYLNDSIFMSTILGSTSSLRNICSLGKKFNILNQFFFMSNQDIKNLSLEVDNKKIFNDTLDFPDESYIFELLKNMKLSPDCEFLYDKVKDLVIKSFPYRKDADPKFHLNSWDAGWYQIRMGILKEHFPKEYSEFRELLLAVRKRMAPLVYELGFLKR